MTTKKLTTFEDRLSDWIRNRFEKVFPKHNLDSVGLDIQPTRNAKFGDFQCNAAMSLAKILKMAPRQIAEQLLKGAEPLKFVKRMEVAGPGFINFYISKSGLSKHLEQVAKDERLGVPEPGEGKRVILDYSSPNVAKPMHIGHIRSTVIGNALDRLYRFAGYEVIADNHLGDWGTQFGLLIMGYRHFLNEDALAEAPVEELERIYVRSHQEAEANPDWRKQARTELVKLQSGDKENRALWKHFVDLTLDEFGKIYGRLGVEFDLYRGESFYNEKLPSVIKRLEDANLARESEGALICDLESDDLKICIVRKRDGGYNYATTDIATVLARREEFEPDRIIYVTDERQQLHFNQFFKICEKLNVETELAHVWFGLMRLPEATFSTREGNVIKLKALLDEAEARALKVVKESSPDMGEADQKEVARAVGIGAVKYADLSQNPQSLVTFTWDKALALDGNTAPYLQYACARISSVEDKYAAKFPDNNLDEYRIEIEEPLERELAIKLALFPRSVLLAVESYRPNLLADYLYSLAKLYSSFYQNVPFLQAEPGKRESRVRLCGVVAKTLRKGLNLLGIETPARI